MAHMAHLNMIMNFLSLARTDQEKSHLTEVKQFWITLQDHLFYAQYSYCVIHTELKDMAARQADN